MPPQYFPQEYTPELTEEFYKRLARPIREETRTGVGQARSEALARGMEGDPFEAIGMGAARTGGATQLADLYAGLGMRGAGMQREERLTGEEREYRTGEREAGQEFQSAEAEKLRAFQERMAQLGYAQWREKEALGTRREYQALPWRTLSSAAGYGAGTWLGNR